MKRLIILFLFVLFIVANINAVKSYVELTTLYYIAALAFMITAGISLLINKVPYKATWVDGLLLLIVIADVVNETFFQKNLYGNPRLYISLTAAILYFGFSFILKNKHAYLPILFWCVVTSVSIQSLVAFAQVMGLSKNTSDMFVFGGSFGNPTAFASYLGIALPFVLIPLLYREAFALSENQYYGILACCISCLFWIAFSNSRGAWAACAVCGLLIANKKYDLLSKLSNVFKSRWVKGLAIAAGVLLVVSTVVGLYYYKKDSAFGRVLVWKISAQHLQDNLLVGNGVGAFEANYGKWQAQYFSANPFTEAEKKVADYVTCAYNEYLELLIDKGLIALLLLASLAVVVIKTKDEGNLYVTAAKYSIIAGLIIACVGYPLRLIPVLLHLSLCTAIVLNSIAKDNQKGWRVHPALAAIGVVLLAVACTAKGLYYAKGFSLLRKGQQQVFSKKLDTGISEYQKAFNSLQNNGVYLFYYGAAMALKKEHGQSIPLLEEAITKASDPNAYILLGNEYMATKQYDKAATAYTTASNITPAKLYPKYLLAKLYITTGQTAKAIQLATEVTTLEDKVHTTAADEMRAEMRAFLKKVNQ